MTVSHPADTKTRVLTLELLEMLFGPQGLQKVSVCLWDGTSWPDETPRPVTLKLNHPGALRAMLLPGTEVAMVEAYLFDDIDILGRAEEIYELGEALREKTRHRAGLLPILRGLRQLPAAQNPRATRRGPARLSGRRHSIARDRQAIAYHYNVSNDFYALMLDKRMVYSCAYFRTPQDSLETAQAQKLDYICRKLRLRPGMRLLDIGCGWGALVMYAAEKYGVDATGVTLSQAQVEFAGQRIREAGLEGRARVLYQDYRELDASHPYDALVSVGMFEHVGKEMLPTYFARAYQLLKPGSVFLNHGVAQRASNPGWLAYSFSNAYVFPDGELLPISHTLKIAEEAGFEVRDVESLREHYILTHRQWVKNLEARHDEMLKYVDEPTYRVWRVAMSYPIYSYTAGLMNLYQTLLVKRESSGASGIPLTREDWYLTS